MEGKPLEESLTLSTYYILALVKLRHYAAASEVLVAFGNLDSPRFRRRNDQGEESLVPFGMRWLSAELQHRLGRFSAAQDSLYRLSQVCEAEALRAEQSQAHHDAVDPGAAQASHGTDRGLESRATSAEEAAGAEEALVLPDGPEPRSLKSASSKWWRRFEAVGLAITNHHLRAKQYLPALQWLRIIERRRRDDPKLISMVGYVQMMMGDLVAAEATFVIVSQMARSDSDLHTRHNRGLLLFARRKYREAQEELEGIVRARPGDTFAVNNHSISQMYCCDLVGGIQQLEAALKSRPLEHLSEPLMMTLTMMYELSLAGAATEAKRRVSQWAAAFAPDDFDLTCMRNP